VFNGLVPRATTTWVRVRELGGGCSKEEKGRLKSLSSLATQNNQPKEEAMKPEEVINVQLEAYNRRDLEAFAATYASDIQVIETDGSRPTLVGIEALRERFGTKTFKLDGLNAEIRSRMVVGNKVIDHEITTWAGIAAPIESVVVYEVENDLITNVWFFDPCKPTVLATTA